MGSPPDDKDFRKAVAGVAPLAESRRVVLRPDPQPPLPRQSERDECSALADSLARTVSLDDDIEADDGRWVLRDRLTHHVWSNLVPADGVLGESMKLCCPNANAPPAGR